MNFPPGMNFLWRLLSRLLLSWPPACKAVGKKAERCRKGGVGRALWPAEPDTLGSYLLLHTPHCAVSSSARESERRWVRFRTYSAFPKSECSLALNSSPAWATWLRTLQVGSPESTSQTPKKHHKADYTISLRICLSHVQIHLLNSKTYHSQ